MSILFTTGATVTFEALLDHVVSVPFLRHLSSLGFRRVVLQYGNQTDQGRNVSKQYFSDVLGRNEVVEKLDLALTNETNDKSVTTFSGPSLELQVFGFSPQIDKVVAAADIVVSHAGTGSILDSLRMHKPLIVVTNHKLMDNHQEEVASQFAKEGFLYQLSAEQLEHGKLEELLTQFQDKQLTFKTLPDPPTGVVESIIAEEATRE